MGEQLRGFLGAYAGLASDEALDKARVWFEEAHQVSFLKSWLKKGSGYRLKEFRAASERRGEAYDLILFLDVVSRLLGAYSTFAGICMMESDLEGNRLETKDRDQQLAEIKASLSLSLFLFEMTTSILRLVSTGQDIAIRILCRSALEASDYWLAIQNDPSLAKRYVDAEEDFDKLWYAELRSEKIVRLRRATLESFFGTLDSAVQEICDFRDEAASDFSLAVHPSYSAGIMSLLKERKWFPEGPQWDFMIAWPHTRSIVFVTDACALPLTLACVNLVNRRMVSLPLPKIRKSRFDLGEEGSKAMLHGLMLAMSGVASHHVRFPSPVDPAGTTQ